MKHRTARLLVLAALFAPLGAQDLRRPDFMAEVKKGFQLVHNLDYDEAEEYFLQVRERHPNHPAPPLYLATAIWLRELISRNELDLNRFLAPAYFTKPTSAVMPEGQRQRFFTYVQVSQKLSAQILRQSPASRDARYFLGLSEGILASFAITIDRSKGQAFSHGKKAYKIHRQLVDEDPLYYDACMSVGLYEYIVGNLPWYIKWIATIIGYRGSEEQGFRYLSLAARKGEYVTDEATVLQMVLFVREKRYAEALENVRKLRGKYPRNYLLHLNEAQILEWSNQQQQAVDAYAEVVRRARERVPNYDRLPMTLLRLELAEKFRQMDRSELALELYQQAASDPRTPAHQRGPAHLKSGQLLDLAGNRSAAERHYRQVLQWPQVSGSHDRAREYLRKPYRN